VHGKKSMVYHDGKTIFSGMDSPFEAGRYHSLAISKKDLPECLEISAYTSDDEIMAVRHKTLAVEGVQFHPESILTKQGKKILKNFIDGKKQGVLFKDILNKIANKQDLTEIEAESVMSMIMNGELTESQIASFLTAMRLKGETVKELVGFVKIMRENADKIDLTGYKALDTCGTGGDGKNTFNISTVASIVATSCGAIIAKHGNRGISSKSGSADLLKALGIKIDLPKEKVRENIINHGMGFMFAPNYHKSMKYVVNSRREMGIRTFFNILGPLSNPAGVKYQVVGVYDQNLTEKIAKVLGELGSKRVFVVSADDGLDEISLCSKTKITEYCEGKINTFFIDPKDYGFEYCKLEDLQVIDIEDSLKKVMEILQGEKNPRRDVVILNTALILQVVGIAKDFKAGIALATDAIDTHKALKKLMQLKS
jgi:anthranilate synthase/phosphoribosyltransferase